MLAATSAADAELLRFRSDLFEKSEKPWQRNLFKPFGRLTKQQR